MLLTDVLSTVNTWQLFNKEPISPTPHSNQIRLIFTRAFVYQPKTLFISWLGKYLPAFYLYLFDVCFSIVAGLSFHFKNCAIFIWFECFIAFALGKVTHHHDDSFGILWSIEEMRRCVRCTKQLKHFAWMIIFE